MTITVHSRYASMQWWPIIRDQCNILVYNSRADSRLAPRQWETLLQRKDVSHWLGSKLELALQFRALQEAMIIAHKITLWIQYGWMAKLGSSQCRSVWHMYGDHITYSSSGYHKISNISHTKSKNLNDSHLILQLSLPNPLNQVLSREWRCSWTSANRQCSNYIWMINNFIVYYRSTYIRDLTVVFIDLVQKGHNIWT